VSTVHQTHERMRALFLSKRLAEAAELARSLPDEQLIWGPYAELWWHFCEELGDAVREGDPPLAARLYALALQSHEKEGSMATGSGEGLASRDRQERIQAKLDAARSGPAGGAKRGG